MATNNSDSRNRTVDLSQTAMYIPNMYGRPKRPEKGDVNRDGIVNNIDRELLKSYLEIQNLRVKIDKNQANIDSLGSITWNDYKAYIENTAKDGSLEWHVKNNSTSTNGYVRFKMSGYSKVNSTLPVVKDTENNRYDVSVPIGKSGLIKATPIYRATSILSYNYNKSLMGSDISYSLIDTDLLIIPDETEALIQMFTGCTIKEMFIPKTLKGIEASFNGSKIYEDITLDDLDVINASFQAFNFYEKLKLLNINIISGQCFATSNFHNTFDIDGCTEIRSNSFAGNCRFYEDAFISNTTKITGGAFPSSVYYKNFNLTNIDTIDLGALVSITVIGDLNIVDIKNTVQEGSFSSSNYGNIYIKDASFLGTFLNCRTENVTCIATKLQTIGNGAFSSLTKLANTATESYNYPDVYIEGYSLSAGAFASAYLKNVHLKNTKGYTAFSVNRVEDILIEDCSLIDAFPRGADVNVNTSKNITLKNVDLAKLFWGTGNTYINKIKNIIVDNSQLAYGSFVDPIHLTESDSKIHIKNNSTLVCNIILYGGGVPNPTVIIENSVIAGDINTNNNGINLTLDHVSGGSDCDFTIGGSSNTTIKNNVSITNSGGLSATPIGTFSSNCRLDTLYFNNNRCNIKHAGSYSVANINVLTIGKDLIYPIVNTSNYNSFGVLKILFEKDWNSKVLLTNFLYSLSLVPWIAGGTNDGIVVLPDSIETIEAYALSTIHSFVFGPNVKSIGVQSTFTSDSNSVFVFKGVVPPTFYNHASAFGNATKVYVPDESIEAYQAAMTALYPTYIVGMSTMPDSLKERIERNTYHES